MDISPLDRARQVGYAYLYGCDISASTTGSRTRGIGRPLKGDEVADDAARDEFLTEASETVDNQYSPDKFYTAARNRKGFGSTLRINVPPEVLSMVSQLVQSKVIPEYSTREAFFRDCIVHRVKYIQDMIRDDRVPVTKTGQIMLMADRAARMLSDREGIELSLKNYEESLRLTSGAERAAIIRQLRADMNLIDDSTFKGRARGILDQYDR